MAVDGAAGRVVAVFRNPPVLAEFDALTGEPAARLPTCGDSDDVWLDPKRMRAYVSCGDGHVAVLRRDGGGSYQEVDRVRTVAGARKSLFVPDLDLLFVAARASGTETAAVWIFRAVGQ
jgi:hypothetical protein